MQHNPTPMEIHEHALRLWTPAVDEVDTAPFTEADRLVATGVPVPSAVPRRAVNWITALHNYEQFWRATGSTPRENTRNRTILPPEERRMGEWARYQRRFEDTRNSFQKTRLDVSPAFKWDPLEQQWAAEFDACIQHVIGTGRLPFLNGEDPVEFALARWLGRQLRLAKVGALPTDRRTRLDALLELARQGGSASPTPARRAPRATR